MQIENDPFLANDQISNWVRYLYLAALDKDPVQASNDANTLAQAMADRLPQICFNEPMLSSTTELVDSPRSSIWLIPALLLAWQRDAFQAAADAEKLPLALNLRSGRACALPCPRAMQTLRPPLQQLITVRLRTTHGCHRSFDGLPTRSPPLIPGGPCSSRVQLAIRLHPRFGTANHHHPG